MRFTDILKMPKPEGNIPEVKEPKEPKNKAARAMHELKEGDLNSYGGKKAKKQKY